MTLHTSAASLYRPARISCARSASFRIGPLPNNWICAGPLAARLVDREGEREGDRRDDQPGELAAVAPFLAQGAYRPELGGPRDLVVLRDDSVQERSVFALL